MHILILTGAIPANAVFNSAARPTSGGPRANAKPDPAHGSRRVRPNLGWWTVALAALWAATSGGVQGATWQTVDAPPRVEYLDIATGDDGEVFAAGDYIPEFGPSQAIVRRSGDGGKTWDILAMPPTVDGNVSQFIRIVAGPNGRVYALRLVASGLELWGSSIGSSGPGGTDFALLSSFYSDGLSVADVAVDPAGAIYVCGTTRDPLMPRWRTLKAVPSESGLSWNTVDEHIPDSTNQFSNAKVIAVRPSAALADKAEEIWVGGPLYSGVGPAKAIMFRRSVDGGRTWQSAGMFDSGDGSAGLQDMAVAPDGTAYATGRARRGAGYAWQVHRQVAGTGDWVLVDEVEGNYGGFGIAVDPTGRVVACGPRWAVDTATLVRLSATGAAGTWGTTDTIGQGRLGALESKVAFDVAGNAYVCTSVPDSGVGFTGLVRKLPASVNPVLAIARLGSALVLSWPVTENPFELESSASLADTAEWQTVNAPLVVSGGRNKVTLDDPTGSAGFFRLRSAP